MKKKIIVVIFAAVFCCSLAAWLTACKKISHEHTYKTEVVAPNCTEQGYTLHTCTGCGDSYKDTYVSALGHSYGEPSWAWSEDYTNATATFTCTNDSEHVNTLTATVTDEVTTPVTCTTDGEKDYTATVTFNNQTYTDVKTVTVKKTGHSISGNSCVNCGQPASEGLDMVLISEGEYTVSGIGTCTDTEILIPTTYNGLPVVSVEASAFLNNTAITSVVLPDSITSIGEKAFNGCESLTSVTFGENSQLTSIGENAFNGCESLTSVTFGKNSQLSSIGPGAFNYCYSLESITIPESVTSIGSDAFYYCYGLRSVTFGENSQLTSIGDGAFNWCESLESITIPASVTSIGEWAFVECYRLVEVWNLSKLNITAGSEDNGYVGYYAKRVETEPSESYVYTDENGYVIYYDGKVKALINYTGNETKLTIPDDITELNCFALSDCYNITSVTFGENSQLTSIGDGAFNWCESLESITIPDSVTSIGEGAFCCCAKLTSITIPDGVKSIGNHAFAGCSALESITIPDSVLNIGDSAFAECTALESITIPDSVLSIGYSAFEGCTALKNITIPGSVLSIGDNAFKECTALESATISEGVKSIGDNAFYNCTNLVNVSLPDSLTSISFNTFYGCNLQTYDDGTASYLGNSENHYLVLVSVISKEITSFTIDDKTKFIWNGAFNGCRSLERVDIPDSILGIGHHAFQDCNSLTAIKIPYGVTTIEDGTFFCCTNMQTITIPETVTSIGQSAFEGCNNLKSISIPNSVTSIGNKAFYECKKLENIIIPDGVTFIRYYTFYGCESLEWVSLPESVYYIDQFAFKNCSSLKSIIIPSAVTKIAIAAFLHCDALTTVYYGGTEDKWSTISIEGNNGCLNGVRKYYFSQTEPEKDGYFWHFDTDGVTPVSWGNEPNYSYGLEYSLNSDGKGYTVVGIGYCEDTDLVIPATYRGLPVTAIGSKAFEYNRSFTSVSIPASVTTIGEYAFAHCGVTSVTFATNSQLTTVDRYAFFSSSSLQSIALPDGVTTIGEAAFNGCNNITSISIPDSITTIENRALDFNSSAFTVYNNAKYLGNSTNPYLVLVRAIDTSITTCNIHTDAKLIYAFAFTDCTLLTSVTIPDRVTIIGNSVFYKCDALESLIIGSGVTSIGDGIIYYESYDAKLKSVYYGGSVEEWNTIAIGKYNGNLTDATRYYYSATAPLEEGNFWHYIEDVPTVWTYTTVTFDLNAEEGSDTLESTKYYYGITCTLPTLQRPGYIFKGWTLDNSVETPVIFTDAVWQITDDTIAFTAVWEADSQMTGFTFTTKAVVVGGGTQNSCTITGYTGSGGDIVIPNGVTTIGKGIFQFNNSITSVVIPDSVTTIGDNAFDQCESLKTVTFGTNSQLTTIGGSAFSFCPNIESISISDSVTSIGKNAFYYCNSLSTVYYGGTAEEWADISIDSTGNDKLTSATVYYYSETEPALNEDETAYDGNYWHFVEGEIVIWVKETV